MKLVIAVSILTILAQTNGLDEIDFMKMGIIAVQSVSDCPRFTSRKVRKHLQSEVYPKLSIQEDELPLTCPFHSSLDMYRVHEQNKDGRSTGDWKCNICGKRFVNEFYLDRHLEKQHSELLPERSVCLSDLCPIFGCRHHSHAAREAKYVSSNSNDDVVLINQRRKRFGSLDRCRGDELDEVKRQCMDISNRCFSSIRNGEAEEKFNRVVCNQLKCNNGVLNGSLKDEIEGPLGFLGRLFRILIVFFLITAGIVTILSMNSIQWDAFINYIGTVGNNSKHSKDYIAKYATGDSIRQSRYGWFLDTIIDALKIIPQSARNLLNRSKKVG